MGKEYLDLKCKLEETLPLIGLLLIVINSILILEWILLNEDLREQIRIILVGFFIVILVLFGCVVIP